MGVRSEVAQDNFQLQGWMYESPIEVGVVAHRDRITFMANGGKVVVEFGQNDRPIIRHENPGR